VAGDFFFFFFFLFHGVQTASEGRPFSSAMGTGGSFPGVKRPGREVDRSPPFSAEVNRDGGIPPLPHTPVWCSAKLIECRDDFTSYC
jgi:hypothetical protein